VSYLDLPRINFGGTWTGNVATANNNPFLVRPGTPKPQQTVLLDFANVRISPAFDASEHLSDVELRQLMNDEYGIDPRNWSYWGGNTASFDTRITSVNLGAGVTAADPLVGQPAGFVHTELCDNNPTGSQSTQMFSDAFSLAGVGLDAGPRSPSRWVWFFRNKDLLTSHVPAASASGVFQTVLPIDAAGWQGLLAIGSPAIVALHAAWQAAGAKAAGLSIRYGLFATLREATGPTVVRSALVSGSIGLATTDELASFPNCRTLYDPAGQNAPVLLQVDQVRKIVSVDLFNALPETGMTHATLAKVPQGDLTLQLTGGGGAPVIVGTITPAQYSMANVNQQGSVVDLDYRSVAGPVDAALSGGASFQLAANVGGSVFHEDFWAATDQRNYYLQNFQDGAITVKVMANGQPVANTPLFLQQFVVDYADDNANDVGGSQPDAPAAWLCAMNDQTSTDANGIATVRLSAKATGNCVIRFTLAPDVNAINMQRDGFANIRILPSDDYAHITDAMLAGQAGFELMYKTVLRYYYLTFPVMQSIVDFSNYQVMTNARVLQMLLAATDPAGWGTYGYMPRTRDLSEPRHTLLARWVKVQQTPIA